MDILIIDDDAEITEMISEYLSMFSHNVDVINFVPKIMIEKTYDIAFLDCHLNNQEYFTEDENYLSKINSKYRFFFTGSPNILDSSAVQQVDGVIQKPVDFDTIKQLIDILRYGVITYNDIKQLKKNGVILFFLY